MTSPLWLSEIGAERREIGVRKLNSNDQMYLYPSLRNPLCTSEYQQVSGLGFGSRLPQQVVFYPAHRQKYKICWCPSKEDLPVYPEVVMAKVGRVPP